MKLYYIDQRKTLPFREPVKIWDEQGNVRFTVKNGGAAGYHLHILNEQGEETASVTQKLMAITPKFNVKVNGKEMTVRLKRRLNGVAYCEIGENNLKAEGSIEKREYAITTGELQTAVVRRVQFSEGKTDPLYQALCKVMNAPEDCLNNGNCCEIEFSAEQNEAEILAIAIAIEAMVVVDSINYSG